MMRKLLLAALSLGLAACDATEQPDKTSAEIVNDVADRYYAWQLSTSPESAYFAGIEPERHDGLHDNSPAALADAWHMEDGLLADIEAVDVTALAGRPEWVTYVLLDQQLRSAVELRVCRRDLWDVNQMGGWHLAYSQVAGLQPVDTADLRQQALARWSRYAAYIDQATANLEAGIANGYSAPQSVVRRVVAQLDGALALATRDSPYFSMASRAGDEAFAARIAALIDDEIYPALRRHRDYLADDYLSAARSQLSVTSNPDGAACYEAMLQSYTTLDRSGKAVYELGTQVVAANKADVVEIGKTAYGLDDFASILEAAKADPQDRFADAEELLAFARKTVERAEAQMPKWVGRMPSQPAAVVPFPEHEEGTGRSARYESGTDERPGQYRIPLYKAEEQSRGNAEAVAFHEVWPGHHLQVAAARGQGEMHRVSELLWFSGPGEGWGRYAEALAEEMGLYTTRSGPILRRAWPARGMVVDPGIHLFGWTREQAVSFMMEAGRFPAEQADAMVDRIAILPGQLTAYDSGALEIVALRREAEAALGDDFDIRAFHDRVLEHGTIPLTYLREHVESWIESESQQ
ncbi:MAG: DUF885 domain-containing protein [Gammaproteobacteria bacterium]|nr:DUF885 domain-containing protein [Gammaproteobacteria bacterium]MBT8093471.1 DUF885 domain-containing protein [Gammaproteobacteria bacterium]MBT8105131.1 DUF885 domain-containing protein [Gammaproteobacteria bacterium]NNF50142.1 DUF885 domain-containing protein [Woeseiaceae bacterium]NNK25145.1 DUF885 domain-containing protein [Woeseiaceae bacterium]